MLKAGTVINKRYEILSVAGSGGMADVYKAQDHVLNRNVAIKVLRAEYSSDRNFVKKFQREAEAAAGLNHPNITSIYDVGEEDGMYYIVMELVDGITLETFIEKKKKLEEREAIEVAMQVSKALDAAHSQGIIHRDVKPQNIMISREGKIKVADFGIARMPTSQTINTGTMGSVHYISPEQARGGYCDERSDIYSLGITMYEMVTGFVPFDGESPVAVALMHVQEEIVPPSVYEPKLTANFEKIILKCTQKKPDNRYSSMAALLQDLKKLLITPDADFVTLPEQKDEAGDPEAKKEDQKPEPGLSAAAAREEREAAAKAKRTENILSYVMIGLSILLVVVMIAIVFKACGLIRTPLTDPTLPSATQAPTRPTDPPTLPPAETESSEEPESTEEPTEPTTAEPTDAEVPRVIGMNYLDASDLLRSLGFQVKYELEDSSVYSTYEVFNQNYSEGTVLPIGTEITIWVALNTSTTVIIPNSVTGMTVAQATAALRALGLRVSATTYSKPSSLIEEGLVVDTNPSLGTAVDKGTTIILIVSSGPKEFELPDLIGWSRDTAKELLDELKYDSDRYVTWEEVYSNEGPETVVAVLDEEGNELEPGTVCEVTQKLIIQISRGKPVLPEVVGLKEEDARVLLEPLGFTVTVELVENSEIEPGLVVAVMIVEQGGYTIVVNSGDEIDADAELLLLIAMEPESTEESSSEEESSPEETPSDEDPTEPTSPEESSSEETSSEEPEPPTEPPETPSEEPPETQPEETPEETQPEEGGEGNEGP